MSVATFTDTRVALPALEHLYESQGLPEFDLPSELAEAYGGALGFSEPRLYANFVTSLDGVVALPGERHSSRLISEHSTADRFVMGLLRACADAVLIGAETMRGSPGTLWTADQAYPPAATLFDELRHARKRPRRPAVAVLSGTARSIPGIRRSSEGALVLTSETGAARLRGRLPRSATIVPIGPTAARSRRWRWTRCAHAATA